MNHTQNQISQTVIFEEYKKCLVLQKNRFDLHVPTQPFVFAYSEQEILRDEILGLQASRDKLKTRVAELEVEVKRTKEELEETKEKAKQASEEGEITVSVT